MRNTVITSCYLAVFLALAGFFVSLQAADGTFPVKPTGSYPDSPETPNECLPEYNWPTFGGPCRKVAGESEDGGGSSTSGASTTGGSMPTGDGGVMGGFTRTQGEPTVPGRGGDPTTPGGGTDPTGSTGSGGDTSTSGATCPPPGEVTGAVQRLPCDENQSCTKDCAEGTPTCANWVTGEDGSCTCEKWETPVECTCAPKCDIPDPENYPFCCSIEPKGSDYPCLMVCTLPNGDKVDIVENPPRCKNFPNCCSEPEETKIGDPRDFCKLKCKDMCGDKYFVDRKPPNPDFPECCTPPVPLQSACACCRESAHRPSSAYCEYFFRFFSCNEPACQAGETCTASGILPPEYVLEYDKFMVFDPRYPFCSGQWNNLNCRYTCKGKGIIRKEDAPTEGIWAMEQYENNYSLEIQRNCTNDEKEQNPVPWPPPEEALDRCN